MSNEKHRQNAILVESALEDGRIKLPSIGMPVSLTKVARALTELLDETDTRSNSKADIISATLGAVYDVKTAYVGKHAGSEVSTEARDKAAAAALEVVSSLSALKREEARSNSFVARTADKAGRQVG